MKGSCLSNSDRTSLTFAEEQGKSIKTTHHVNILYKKVSSASCQLDVFFVPSDGIKSEARAEKMCNVNIGCEHSRKMQLDIPLENTFVSV